MMMYKHILLLIGCYVALNSQADAKDHICLPWFFGSNMVVQRQKPVKIWGNARPGCRFEIRFAGKTVSVHTNKNGTWQALFPPQQAGGPFEMHFISDSSFSFTNILCGDVWLCSGQSNMEWPMLKTFNSAFELRNANLPAIRCLTVPQTISSRPAENTRETRWEMADSIHALQFSAVAFFFAKEIYRKQRVPVGIIHASWGGTPVESWMPLESISTYPDFESTAATILSDNRAGNTIEKEQQVYADSNARFNAFVKRADKGYREQWYAPSFHPAGWPGMTAPGLFTDTLANFRGSIWLRKEVWLPACLKQRPLVLNLEIINERDIAWFNGVQVGATGWAPGRRIYLIPAELVQEGQNSITIRMESFENPAGFRSRNEADLRLNEAIGSVTPVAIPLSGIWYYKTGLASTVYPKAIVPPKFTATPAVLYNGMIAPFKDLALKGILWYQGETNAARAFQYSKLFPLLINSWRARFQQGDLPFLFVQLPGLNNFREQDGATGWTELREAQSAALSLPNTGMAVTIDAGNPGDVHPSDKQTVGKRLAAVAAQLVYHTPGQQVSPLYESCNIEKDTVFIKVSNASGGLEARGKKTMGFMIAGADQVFHTANAGIWNNEIRVWSSQVKQPVAVRYAWSADPVNIQGANVYNKGGFPLAPFRTDDWEWSTRKNK